MQTALRRMGNSTGMIVPAVLLKEMGVSVGTAMDVRVEDGKIVATPVKAYCRAGWGEAAAQVADDDDVGTDWRAFGTEGDADLTW